MAAIAEAHSLAAQESVTEMTQKVSFIIPHKGREAMLIDTIESIAKQNYSAEDIEIILVSQNPEVSEQVAKASGEVSLLIISSSENNTISTSRNLGASHATGDFLAFLDADIKLANNWLSACLTILTERPNTKLVSAMQIASDAPTPLEFIRVALSNADLDRPVSFLPGRNLLLHKATFYAAGQFPEDLVTCEDYYFTDKVNELGELFYTSETCYVHIGEDKVLGAMFEKEIWRGQSNLASTRDRRIPLREWPSFVVPLAIPGLLFLSAILTLALSATIGMITLIFALLPVLLYSFRLKKLVGNTASFWDVLKFYSVYFPARALGTLGGILKTIGTTSHGK